jgi:diaminopimelate decarboxylase
MLMVGGCRLDDVAREYGTPVMVVDEDALRRRARDYRERLAARWPDSRVVFASKALPCTVVQRLMVSEGLWIDVAGGGGSSPRWPPAPIRRHWCCTATPSPPRSYSSRSDPGWARAWSTTSTTSTGSKQRCRRGHEQDCLVRVIPGVQASTQAAHATGHEGSKFGLSPLAAKQAIARIEASDRLRMLGLHTDVGSQILRAEELAAAAPLAAVGQYPARTATRCRSTTTAPAGSRWCSPAAAGPVRWSAARWTTCWRGTWPKPDRGAPHRPGVIHGFRGPVRPDRTRSCLV